MNAIEKMRVHEKPSGHLYQGVEGTESWVGGEGRGGADLDRVIREGLLEVVTSEPRLE